MTELMKKSGDGYVTIAFGSDKYLKIARNLARSLKMSSPGRKLALVTDLLQEPDDDFDIIIPLDPQGGRSLFHKLLLDTYTPFARTMFIDSDCLVVRDLEPIWRRYAKHPFVVVGSMELSGPWFGTDVRDLRARMGIDGPLPKFNSGFIYWEHGDVSTNIFHESRRLWSRYRELGLGDFRASIPIADEPLFSLAMASQSIAAYDDDGSVMNTPIGLSGRVHIDIAQGKCSFVKHSRTVSPAIAHFCGYFRQGPIYRREAALLAAATGGPPLPVPRRVLRALFEPFALLDNSWTWASLRRLKRMLSSRRTAA